MTQFPERPASEVPAVTAGEMLAVDEAMISEAGIDLVRMMENAGRGLAELTLARFAPGTVTVLAGTGGNGGGGLVAARHLANRGVEVRVTLASSDLSIVPRVQHAALENMGVSTTDDPVTSDLVIDALVGYSLRGAPFGRVAELAAWAVAGRAPIVALDTPTGLDVTTGVVAPGAIRADATLTLALPKRGLLGAESVGELYLADISVPSAVWERLGLDVPADLFAESQIVRLV